MNGRQWSLRIWYNVCCSVRCSVRCSVCCSLCDVSIFVISWTNLDFTHTHTPTNSISWQARFCSVNSLDSKTLFLRDFYTSQTPLDLTNSSKCHTYPWSHELDCTRELDLITGTLPQWELSLCKKLLYLTNSSSISRSHELICISHILSSF